MKKKLRFKTQEIFEFLESITPFSYQESWDNSGLILGGFEQGFNKIYLALEVDRKVLESLEEDSLHITHHPLIFSPLKQLIEDSYPASLIKLKKVFILIYINLKWNLNEYIINIYSLKYFLIITLINFKFYLKIKRVILVAS